MASKRRTPEQIIAKLREGEGKSNGAFWSLTTVGVLPTYARELLKYSPSHFIHNTSTFLANNGRPVAIDLDSAHPVVQTKGCVTQAK
jgi:hypothetical protein